jgi:hypothetical protein
MTDTRRSRPARRSKPSAVDLSPRNTRRRGVTARARRRATPPSRPRRDRNPVHLLTSLAGSWPRPGLRVLVLCIEVGAAVLMVTSPAFAARQVDVSGIHHLQRSDVLRLGGLSGTRNVFLVTPEAAENALRTDPYVRSVAVTTSLPDRVEVSIEEWEPLGLVHRGGHDYLLNAEGTVLSPATGVTVGPAAGLPHVEVNWAAPGSMRSGDHVLNGLLLQDLKNIQDAFPTAYGLTISAIDLTADQQLTLETREGPRILFGQMVTAEQVASLQGKLASLKALGGKVDLAHSKLDYVNLMNQNQPVTHAIPSPSPSPRPSTSPRPTASPKR